MMADLIEFQDLVAIRHNDNLNDRNSLRNLLFANVVDFSTRQEKGPLRSAAKVLISSYIRQ
jgi:hypothetical protein